MKCINIDCIFCNWGICTGDPDAVIQYGCGRSEMISTNTLNNE